MLFKALKAALLLYALYFLVGGMTAPLLAQSNHPEIADLFYSLFSASCQQQPTRTFWLLGYPMALCARCIGIYAGFAFMSCFWVKGNLKINKFLLGGLLTIGLGEKLMEWCIWEANNLIRFLSGLFFGAFLLMGLALIIQFGWRFWEKYEFKKRTMFRN